MIITDGEREVICINTSELEILQVKIYTMVTIYEGMGEE
jgi:hypothetical protein